MAVLLDLGDIYCRRFTYNDIDCMYDMMQDTNTIKHVSNRKKWSIHRVTEFIKWNIEHDDDTYYAIIRKNDNAFVGYIGHKKYTYTKNALYMKNVVTIVIKDKGKGYGKRVMRSYIDYCSNNGVALYASVDKDNAISNRLFTSLGYQPKLTLLVDNITSYIYIL